MIVEADKNYREQTGDPGVPVVYFQSESKGLRTRIAAGISSRLRAEDQCPGPIRLFVSRPLAQSFWPLRSQRTSDSFRSGLGLSWMVPSSPPLIGCFFLHCSFLFSCLSHRVSLQSQEIVFIACTISPVASRGSSTLRSPDNCLLN